MEKFYLENMHLKVEINQQGAELARILNKENGTDYLWNGDPVYWKRHAPVLFPIVGNVQGKALSIDGKRYPMSQHGFARDTDFKMTKQKNGKEITFSLSSDEATKEIYPYDFLLEIRYQLEGYRLVVNWMVTNTGDRDMHFQIGGHPAFYCPAGKKGKQTDCWISFDTDKELKYSLLDDNGLVASYDHPLKTEEGLIPVTEGMFDQDALIFEGHQASKVSLCGPDKIAYVSVSFDSPVFGIWSPEGGAPFICIEPWYGRADDRNFHGDIAERQYDNPLKPGETFEKQYSMLFA